MQPVMLFCRSPGRSREPCRLLPPVPNIESSRLLIRPARSDDFPPLYERVLSDPAVMQFVYSGKPLSTHAARVFFREQLASEPTDLKPGVLELKCSREVIGYAGLFPSRALNKSDYEFGFALAQSHWGRGFATECGAAQIRFALARWPRVLALAHPRNAASNRVLSKLGMRWVMEIQRYYGEEPRNVYAAERR